MTAVADVAANETAAEEERRTTFLELFFDLVFVFAITQVTALVLADMTPMGFARAALVLGLVWWTWSGYAWMTSAIDVENTLVRVLLLAATGGSFLVALAIPQAFDTQGVWFVAPYVAVRVLHVALFVWGLRGDPLHQASAKKLGRWFLVAPAVALVGGLLDDPDLRAAVWTLSLAIDVAGALTAGRLRFRLSPGHFAERYGLFVIIALGESIVAIGVGAADAPRDLTFAVAVAIAFAGVAGLWWAYFDFTALAQERALRFASEERRGPLARDLFTFFHFPLVLGIIFFAVAAENTLAHPHDPISLAARFALGGGIALYLSSFVLARIRVARRIAWERIAGGAGAVALALGLDDGARERIQEDDAQEQIDKLIEYVREHRD